MAAVSHQILDVVEFKVDSGRWRAGTIGTVVEADVDQALVERRHLANRLVERQGSDVRASAPGRLSGQSGSEVERLASCS
jgi:hypothetical protein